jgi:hypothetical protein
MQRAVAADEVKYSKDYTCAPFAAGWTIAARECPSQQDATGDDVAEAGD